MLDFHYICILPDRKNLIVKGKDVVKRLASETSWVFCCTSCENYFSPNIRFNSNESLHTVESNETLHDAAHVQSLKQWAVDGRCW